MDETPQTIAELQEYILGLQNKVDDLVERDDDREAELQQTKRELSQMQDSYSRIKRQIEDIESSVRRLKQG